MLMFIASIWLILGAIGTILLTLIPLNIIKKRQDTDSFKKLHVSTIMFLITVIPNFLQQFIWEISMALSIIIIYFGGIGLIQYIVFLILTLDKEHQELRRKENKLRKEYRRLKAKENIKMMEDYINNKNE